MNNNIAQYIERERNSQHNRNAPQRVNSGNISVHSMHSMHSQAVVRLPSVIRLFLAAKNNENSNNNGAAAQGGGTSSSSPTVMSRRVRVDRIRDRNNDNNASYEKLLQLAAETYQLDPAFLRLTYQMPEPNATDGATVEAVSSLIMSDEDIADALLFLGGGMVDVTCHPMPKVHGAWPSFLRLNMMMEGGTATSNATLVRLIDVERILDDKMHKPSLQKLALVGREVNHSTTNHTNEKKNGIKKTNKDDAEDWKFVYVRPSDGCVFWLATDRDLQDAFVAATSTPPAQAHKPQHPSHNSNTHANEIALHAVRNEAQLAELLGSTNNQPNGKAASATKSNNQRAKGKAYSVDEVPFEGSMNMTQASLDLDPVFQGSASQGLGLNNSDVKNAMDEGRWQALEQTVQEQAEWIRQQQHAIDELQDQVRETVERQQLQADQGVKSELEETARQAAEEVNDERLEELEQELEEFKTRLHRLQSQVSKQEVLMVERLDELKTLLVDAAQQDRVKELEQAVAKQKTSVNDLVMSFVMRLKQLESNMATVKQQQQHLASTGERPPSPSSDSDNGNQQVSRSAYASPTPADRARASMSANSVSSLPEKKNRLMLLPEAAKLAGVGCQLGSTKQTSHVELRAINNVLSWDLKEQITPGQYRAVLPLCRGDPGGASLHVGVIKASADEKLVANKLRGTLPLVQFVPTESWEQYTKATTSDLIEVKGEPGEVFVVVSGGWYCDVRAISLEYAGSLQGEDTADESSDANKEKTATQVGATPARGSAKTQSPSPQRGFSSPLRARASDSAAVNKSKSNSDPKGTSPLRAMSSTVRAGAAYNSPLRARSANGGEAANRPLASHDTPLKSRENGDYSSPPRMRLGSGLNTPLRRSSVLQEKQSNAKDDSTKQKQRLSNSFCNDEDDTSLSQDNSSSREDDIMEFKK